MDTNQYEEAFHEHAISIHEARNSCNRFVAFRTQQAIAFRLTNEQDADDVKLVSKDEVLHLLSEQLERGAQIQIAE